MDNMNEVNSMEQPGFAKGQSTQSQTEAAEAVSEKAQESSPGNTGVPGETPKERKAAYDDFIRRYKKEDEERLSALFKKRFRQEKSAMAQLSALEGAFSPLMRAHGETSLANLAKTLSAASGNTPGAAKKAVSETVDQWMAEASEVKKRYSAFDLKAALSDKAFAEALRSTGSVWSAYRLTNFSGILEEEKKKAASAVTASIRARGNRVSELGAKRAASREAIDVSRLTNEQLADISKRSRRGETIRF